MADFLANYFYEIKKEYCLKNNIKIVYTTYKDKNIYDIIKKYIIEEE